jgi:hypothetical protein
MIKFALFSKLTNSFSAFFRNRYRKRLNSASAKNHTGEKVIIFVIFTGMSLILIWAGKISL